MLVRQKLESIPITVDSESTKQLLRSSHRAPSLARALPSRDFRGLPVAFSEYLASLGLDDMHGLSRASSNASLAMQLAIERPQESDPHDSSRDSCQWKGDCRRSPAGLLVRASWTALLSHASVGLHCLSVVHSESSCLEIYSESGCLQLPVDAICGPAAHLTQAEQYSA